MSLHLDPALLLAVFLMSCRLAGVFVASPVLGFSGLPQRVRVIFVLVCALVLAGPARVAPPAGGLDLIGLIILSAVALLQGALVGAALRAAIAAFGFGGQLVDFQIGFNAAAIFNPATNVQGSLISSALETLGALMFVLLDLHHLLLRGLADTFRAAPTAGLVPHSVLQAALDQSAMVFVFGLAVVMPVVAGLFLIDISIAAISRSMPQINIYFVALPLKAFAGLALLAVALGYLGPLAGRIFSEALAGLAPQAS